MRAAWLGFVPDEVPSAPPAAVGRLARQLGLPVEVLCGYGVSREQTRTDHLRQVAKYLGWRPAKSLELTEAPGGQVQECGRVGGDDVGDGAGLHAVDGGAQLEQEGDAEQTGAVDGEVGWRQRRRGAVVMCGRARRHCRDHERLPQVSDALINWAAVILMTRRLTECRRKNRQARAARKAVA